MPQEQQVVENLVKIQELSGALSQLLDQNQNTIKSLLDQSDWIKVFRVSWYGQALRVSAMRRLS